jgi:hypothetical protein
MDYVNGTAAGGTETALPPQQLKKEKFLNGAARPPCPYPLSNRKESFMEKTENETVVDRILDQVRGHVLPILDRGNPDIALAIEGAQDNAEACLLALREDGRFNGFRLLDGTRDYVLAMAAITLGYPIEGEPKLEDYPIKREPTLEEIMRGPAH